MSGLSAKRLVISGIATPSEKMEKPSSSVPPLASSQMRVLPAPHRARCRARADAPGRIAGLRRPAWVILWRRRPGSAACLRLALALRVVEPPDLVEIDGRLRQLQFHVFHRVGDDLRDREIAEPFVVRRNDVPRRVLLRAVRERILESVDVVVPVVALAVVRRADLPLPSGIVEPLLEAGKLLVLRDVEKEFQDRRVVGVVEKLLPLVDEVVARLPDWLGHELVHAHDQHILVVRAIEYRDLALGRRMRMDAPQEVVRLLFGVGCLKPCTLTP